MVITLIILVVFFCLEYITSITNKKSLLYVTINLDRGRLSGSIIE